MTQESLSRFLDAVERFSAPILSAVDTDSDAPPNPSGENIRKSDAYGRIKSLRYYPDPSESLADDIWKAKTKQGADWPTVVQLCEEILLHQSKDVQVLGWYAEALLNTKGIIGLCEGLTIFAKVCDAHWETIHPIDDDGDMAYRLVTFNWLESFITPLVLATPLVSGTDGVRNLYDIEQRKSQSSEEGLKAQGELKEKFMHSPADELIALHESVTEALQALEELEPFVSDLAEQQNESAGFEKLFKNLRTIKDLSQDAYHKKQQHASEESFANEASPFMEDQPLDQVDQGEMALPEFSNPDQPSWQAESSWAVDESFEGPISFGEGGQISSSQEAYRLIHAANQYLLKNDPHSPCPFLVRRALSWRKKSLYELYMELFQSIEKPGDLFELLGLTDTDPKGRLS